MDTMGWEGTFPGDFQIARPLPLKSFPKLPECEVLSCLHFSSLIKDSFVVEAPAPWWCAGTELGPAGQEARGEDKER